MKPNRKKNMHVSSRGFSDIPLVVEPEAEPDHAGRAFPYCPVAGGLLGEWQKASAADGISLLREKHSGGTVCRLAFIQASMSENNGSGG
jgi:hypothetical protein